MAAIHELLKQVSDPALRARLTEEFNRVTQNKKFGLVFEEHMPECTPLYGIRIKRGATVAKKAKKINDTYTVIALDGDTAVCRNKSTGETEEIAVSELAAVAEFGDPIFPCLEPIDRVENAPDSDLWHTLIEADNYHALQLLEYLYAGKVDCIYIDPPYNTGTDDWKYNDAYVDSSDKWAHSKWLSMMKKRLLLSKRILSEKGIIIISIGYQEVHRLALLCEEIFSDKQVVTVTVQTSGGKPSGGFNYMHEYLVFIVDDSFSAQTMSFSGGKTRSPFEGLTLATFTQTQRPNQVYPIYVEKETGIIRGCGQSISDRVDAGNYEGDIGDFDYDYSEAPEGCVAIWPITTKGDKCVWRLISSRVMHDWNEGYIKVIENKAKNNQNKFSIQYLPEGVIKKILAGRLSITAQESDRPTLILGENETEGSDIPTIWTEKLFYTSKGTSQLQDIFGSKEFPYPKPIDLIADVLRATTNPNSLILDFFAGSGTTLNAVNLINSQDDGQRRCILVTNNEVSKKLEKELLKKGLHAGDVEWEKHGIAYSVTWPRICYTILGKRGDGTVMEGKYSSDNEGYERPLSLGFESNVEFFKLSFLERDMVSLGKQFHEILPLLWMKSGAVGKRPEVKDEEPIMLVLPKNHFAILVEEDAYAAFAKEVCKYDTIDTVYFVTNSEAAYHEMSADIGIKNTYQLYRDYIDNFVIGARRDRT